RFQVAFTLGEVGGDLSLGGLVAIALRDASDHWMRTALLSSATADPCGLFERLWQDRAFADSRGGIALLRLLALVVGARNRSGRVARILADVSTIGNMDREAALAALLGLGDGLSRAGRRLSELKAEVPPGVNAWLDRVLANAERWVADSSQTSER